MTWLFGIVKFAQSWLRDPTQRPSSVKASAPVDPVAALSNLEIVARTIWGEARNQGSDGMKAVACVIQNRAKIGGWWGKTPRDVCLKPYQFSCWNLTNAERPKLLTVAATDLQYQTCLSLAHSVLAGTLKDTTNKADSYEVRGTDAEWTIGKIPVASIGAHDFYRTA